MAVLLQPRRGGEARCGPDLRYAVAEQSVALQLTEADRDTCPAKKTRPHTLALLSFGDTVT